MAGVVVLDPRQTPVNGDGTPYPHALRYVYQKNTSSLIALYADRALTQALPNPVEADDEGTFPPIYVATTFATVRIRTVDADGVEISDDDDVPLGGGSSGGGGPGGPGEPGTPGAPGADAIYIILTRPATSVPADSAGVVSDFSGANGILKVYRGGTEITDQCALSITAQTNCVGTINAAANNPVNNQPLGYYAVSSLTADTGELRLRAVFSTLTLDAVFTVVKARGGAQGAPGTGAGARTLVLSKDSAFAPSFADGTVSDYSQANGLARMFDGPTEVTATTTFAVTAVGCTGTINTADNTPVAGQPKGYFRITAMTSDPATLTITATYSSTVVQRVFTLAKLRGGYEIVTTLPTTNLFEGRIVFLTTDDKIYRYTGSAWTTTINAGDVAGTFLGSQIAAGSITAAQLAVTQLSAISSNVGTLTAGVLRNVSGSTRFDLGAGTILFDNGAVMKATGNGFGSTGQFIEWFGPRQPSLSNCTEFNATYYLKTNGDAYFGGALRAGTLYNSRQTTDLAANASVVLGPFGTNGNVKTVVVSYTFFKSGRRNGNQSGNTSGSTAASIGIYRTIGGGAESLVATLTVANGTTTAFYEPDGDYTLFQVAMGGSLTYTDNVAGTDQRTYRAALLTRTELNYGGTASLPDSRDQSLSITSTES